MVFEKLCAFFVWNNLRLWKDVEKGTCVYDAIEHLHSFIIWVKEHDKSCLQNQCHKAQHESLRFIAHSSIPTLLPYLA